MTYKRIRVYAILLFSFLFAISTVSAAPAIATISQGNTVFLGEQGLDITGALGGSTQIGWWASGAAVATSSPDQTYSISSPTNFFVLPSSFGSYTGAWYRLDNTGKAAGPAFTVADPQLSVKVEDTTAVIDATNKWVPRGDQVRFGFETNLVAISQRSQSPSVTLYVQAPDGAQYSSLINSAGVATRIDNIVLTTNPYFTNSIWDTGNSIYAPGIYTIWAECNVNGMKDNYGVTGKTISSQVTVLDQDQNPLIQSRTQTTAPTAKITTSPPTTMPITSQTTIAQTTPQPTTILTTANTPVPETSALPTLTAQTTVPPTTQSPGFGLVTVISAAIICFTVYSRENSRKK